MSVNNINHSYYDISFSIHQHHFWIFIFSSANFQKFLISFHYLPFLSHLIHFSKWKGKNIYGEKKHSTFLKCFSTNKKWLLFYFFLWTNMSFELISWRLSLMLILYSVFSLMFQCLNLSLGRQGKYHQRHLGFTPKNRIRLPHETKLKTENRTQLWNICLGKKSTFLLHSSITFDIVPIWQSWLIKHF